MFFRMVQEQFLIIVYGNSKFFKMFNSSTYLLTHSLSIYIMQLQLFILLHTNFLFINPICIFKVVI